MTEKDMLSCVSFLLGKVHGEIAMLLNEPIDNLRPNLKKLFDNLTCDVARLYYPNPDQPSAE